MESDDQEPGTSSGKYSCPLCDLQYQSKSAQVRHLRTKHGEQSSSFVKSEPTNFGCDLCVEPNLFAHRGDLMRHHEENHGFVPKFINLQFKTMKGQIIQIYYPR
ncbi:hypothetical protein MTO96_050154 [Rhipicephalus appendiculatus]